MFREKPVKHSLPNGAENGLTELLCEEGDRDSDGDILLGECCLDSKARSLHSKAQTKTNKELIGNPVRSSRPVAIRNLPTRKHAGFSLQQAIIEESNCWRGFRTISTAALLLANSATLRYSRSGKVLKLRSSSHRGRDLDDPADSNYPIPRRTAHCSPYRPS
uniref:Uncharacterized protein n=1 Tax=Fusarium oxysporum (strain Fo5176) TaxID=660025 RepID=A0A0D2YHZ2_FUSOF